MTPKTFESALSQLEKIVQELENPELPLEKGTQGIRTGSSTLQILLEKAG